MGWGRELKGQKQEKLMGQNKESLTSEEKQNKVKQVMQRQSLHHLPLAD